jgi:8-oxo-dGTP pyrophosphatase MutT (NUDIX family)
MINTKDPFFGKVYNQEILRELARRSGPFLYHHIDLTISTEIMLRLMTKMEQKKPRRAEVVMVIPNLAGQFWVHTKNFYPKGVYRLLTGGLEPGEAPWEALRREAREETGFDVGLDRCLAVITHTFANAAKKLPFASYVFLTTPADGIPQPIDAGENIADFQAVPAERLAEIGRQLRLLEGRFADWGIFRAIAHELSGQMLR